MHSSHDLRQLLKWLPYHAFTGKGKPNVNLQLIIIPSENGLGKAAGLHLKEVLPPPPPTP